MKKTYFLLSLLIVLISCKENAKNVDKTKSKIAKDGFRDKLLGKESDTVYEKKWLSIDFKNGRIEESEIYVSNYNDSIPNQFKLYFKNQIDRKQSEYYDLKIWKTKKPNIYKGRITMHTEYENLELNNANKRTVEFAYCEQTKDSIRLKYVESTTSTTIDFEFENYFGKRLQGKLYQLVYRDTIVNGEKMLNMRQTHLLVDNYPETVNLFLETTSAIKEKKFNPKKIKLKVIN